MEYAAYKLKLNIISMSLRKNRNYKYLSLVLSADDVDVSECLNGSCLLFCICAFFCILPGIICLKQTLKGLPALI